MPTNDSTDDSFHTPDTCVFEPMRRSYIVSVTIPAYCRAEEAREYIRDALLAYQKRKNPLFQFDGRTLTVTTVPLQGK